MKKMFNRNNKENKKGIGPIIAIGLLMTVTVISIVAFQIWFQGYSNKLTTNIEIDSKDAITVSGIEGIIGNSLYFLNGGSKDLEIKSVKINGEDCYVSGSYSPGMNEIPLPNNCISDGVGEIVVVTIDKVISNKKKIDKNDEDDSNTGSGTGTGSSTCPEGYILVPGNSNFMTSNFCVMKYEAKNSNPIGSGPAVSQETLVPWTGIIQNEAITKCSELGSKYHLISNNEWMTIARNIEQQDENWVNSNSQKTSVGVGSLKQGNLGFGNPGAYYNKGGLDYNTGNGRNTPLAELTLSNGETILDLNGNAQEWISNLVSDIEWKDNDEDLTFFGYWGENGLITNTFYINAGPSDRSLNSSSGVGYIHVTTVETNGVVRGGGLNSWESIDGIYTIDFNRNVNEIDNSRGFRCAYTP